ncbi:uncharacterized protein DUF1538 [Trichococcus patagoniensis]|uniref:Uncharacterized protein DUF1538 n=1 Tax=Trichococcus patagoniensis TaxID=382641 RepID=A0A2T5IK15_9LACT|nr:DUF1538 domain-containing protein [Trichococcus patagoniensis]PTQ84157.1 uncharacterized protein DUF1538 [Trichococcus patagoniensis]
MKLFLSKIREVLHAVLPIVAIVLLLHATLTPLTGLQLQRFLLGAFLITVGLSIFLHGIDFSISMIGKAMGRTFSKTDNLFLLGGAGLALGFIISIAEPDLHILAGQVERVAAGAVAKWEIILVVSLGIAAMLALGLIRIVKKITLHKMLAFLYAGVFGLALFASDDFLAIAFDASGATTGAMTVPFIMSLALGVTLLRKNTLASNEEGFGLIGVVSVGPIIAVLVMDLFRNDQATANQVPTTVPAGQNLLGPFLDKVPIIAEEVLLALLPIFLIFTILQRYSFRLSRRNVSWIVYGLLLTYIGLFLFLLGAQGGFMDVGRTIGFHVASLENKQYLLLIGFVLGFVTVLAEPAVHVLTHQIEEITGGAVKRKAVRTVLSLGIGTAVALSMLRIIFPVIQLWHILLPGYLIALTLAFFVPKMFVGIAFDSGGVASGPMTATFILSFVQGAASAMAGDNLLSESFGMIALVAMTPIIAVQLLGLVYKLRAERSSGPDI